MIYTESDLCLDERNDEILLVFGISVDVHLTFAGEPAKGGKHFFIFQFSCFFELFNAHGVSCTEGLPNEAGVVSDNFYIHSLNNDYFVRQVVYRNLFVVQKFTYFVSFCLQIYKITFICKY